MCESEGKVCSWANGEESHHVTLGEKTAHALRDLGVLKSWYCAFFHSEADPTWLTVMPQ